MSAEGDLPEDGLPPIRHVLQSVGHRGSRHWGQHFIHDLAFTRKIARAAGSLAGFDVLEIGPGPGGLTRALLMEGARRVVAVERDHRCFPALEQIRERWPERLDVIHGDARIVDGIPHLRPPARIIANLPYGIAVPLIVSWVSAEAWRPVWTDATIMLQRELAERIASGPGTRAYGRLSVLVQWRTAARIVMQVPASVFVPPPKVRSSLLRIAPIASPETGFLPSDLERVTKAAFSGRRKTLRRSLIRISAQAEAWLADSGIDPGLRADALPVSGYCALARTAARFQT